MARYECGRCHGLVDAGELKHYPGFGDVCEDCVEELDAEAAHRSFFGLTKHQQREVKYMLPGIRLEV